MSTLSQQSQAVIDAFGQQSGVTQEHRDNLRAAIEGSPFLIDHFNAAVASGCLKQVRPLMHPHAGGEYDGEASAIRLPIAKLVTQSGQNAELAAGEITFVLGHELQHGFDYASRRAAYSVFQGLASQAAQGDHDYSAEIGALITENRKDEAGAEIAGWNAVVSMVKKNATNPTLSDVYRAQPGRMADFIDRSGVYPDYSYALKPNLQINADLTLMATTGNLEAMGQNYFDKPAKDPGGLGPRGNSDYANYYGAYGISTAAYMERKYNPAQPHIVVNLAQLKLTEKLLEENGIDLGGQLPAIPYVDSSHQPPIDGLFQHTRATHQHRLPISPRIADVESPQLQRNDPTLDPTQPGHRDHALYQQARDGVAQLDARHGRHFDATSERLTASLLALAKQNGITRVDHVALSVATPELPSAHNIFVVQGRMDDPANLRAHLPTAAAAQAPVAESFQRVQAINEALAAEQVQPRSIESPEATPRQQRPALAR